MSFTKHSQAVLVIASSIYALAITGCAPSQQPCSPANIGLAQLKDEGLVGTMPEVDQVMNSFVAHPTSPVPGVAVGIVQDNQITYLKGYGYADLGDPNVDGDETLFTKGTMSRLGSVSKTLTAVGILQLANQGYLNLNDPISTHLPGVPPAWNGLTIRQLLTHQSGLPKNPVEILNPEGWLNATFPWASPHPGIQPRLAYYTYIGTPVAFPAAGPNDAYYSNTGFSILGAIIDSVTMKRGFAGKAGYEEFLWWNTALRGGQLSEPTMTSMCLDTYWRHDGIKDIAKGYALNALNKLDPVPSEAFSGWEGPPGGWDMTIGDLARLAIALRTNKLLDAGTMQDMTTGHSTFIGQDYQYGYGIFAGTLDGRPVYSHKGDIEGYTARFTVWPQQNFAIALLSNRRDADLRSLESQIANLFLSNTGFGGGQAAPRARMTEDDFRKTRTAEYAVATQHYNKLTRLVEESVRQTGTLDGALRLLEAKLAGADPSGKLVRALERGDYRTASVLYLQLYQKIPELR